MTERFANLRVIWTHNWEKSYVIAPILSNLASRIFDKETAKSIVGSCLRFKAKERKLKETVESAARDLGPDAKILILGHAQCVKKALKGFPNFTTFDELFPEDKHSEVLLKGATDVSALTGCSEPPLDAFFASSFRSFSHHYFRSHALSEIQSSGKKAVVVYESFFPLEGIQYKGTPPSLMTRIRKRLSLSFIFSITFYMLACCIKRMVTSDSHVDPGHHNNHSKTPRPYLVVFENGSMVNTTVSEALLDEFITKGIDATVLTNSPTIVEKYSKRNLTAHYIQFPSYKIPNLNELKSIYSAHNQYSQLMKHAQSHVLHASLESYRPYLTISYLSHLRSKLYIDTLYKAAPPNAVLTIGEGYEINILAALSREASAAPWLAWTPIMIPAFGITYYPAQYHLFYGQHGTDIFIKGGGNIHTVATVGSPTYDGALARSKERDEQYVKKMIPNWNGKTLFVVGTENISSQLPDIIEVLKLLKEYEEAYCIVKLHPFDSLKEYTELLDSLQLSADQTCIIKECELDALLNVADILFTVSSNIIVNAELLGTPILIHDPRNVRTIDFPKYNIGQLSLSVNELRENINFVLSDQKQNSGSPKSPFGGSTGRLTPSVAEVTAILRRIIETGEFADDSQY